MIAPPATMALSDDWHMVKHNIAFEVNVTRKELSVMTRFDGNGNSVVRFVVKIGDQTTEYEKFDAAVYNYEHAR